MVHNIHCFIDHCHLLLPVNCPDHTDLALSTMADVEKPTADGAGKSRPEKPDETKFKASVEQAEKEHKAAQAKFVRSQMSCAPWYVRLTMCIRKQQRRRWMMFALVALQTETTGGKSL